MTQVGHSLSAVGKMALRTEIKSNLSIVGVVLLYEGIIDKNDIIDMLEERVIPNYSRFSSIVQDFKFIPQKNFNIEEHVYMLDIPSGKDKEEYLNDIISPIQNTPLNMNKPLWNLGIGYLYSDNITVLYWRIHHCICDGVSIVILINSICDEYWNNELQLQSDNIKKKKKSNIITNIIQGILFFIGILLVFLHWIYSSIYGIIKQGAPKELKPKSLSHEKKVAWDRNIIKLDKVKQVLYEIEQLNKTNYHITLNDLMISCMTKAIKRYLHETYKTKAEYLPIVVPVNLRSSLSGNIGNKIGSLSFLIPMNIDDPISRVIKISKITHWGKKLPEPYVTYYMTQFFTYFPNIITNFVFNLLSSQVYCVMSNVRGSSVKLSYKGYPLKGILGFVPPPNSVSLGIGLASYNNYLGCTINCDKSVIPFPKTIIKYYKMELESLVDIYCNKNDNKLVY